MRKKSFLGAGIICILVVALFTFSAAREKRMHQSKKVKYSGIETARIMKTEKKAVDLDRAGYKVITHSKNKKVGVSKNLKVKVYTRQ